MITITRWAGRHPLLVRIVLLPILFYLQGRLAFVAGAELFFKGISLPAYWVWAMIAVIWVATFIYPQHAKQLLHTAYWRVKGIEWVACTAAFGLWFYAGNDMARQFESVPTETHQQAAVPVITASVVSSETTTVNEERSSDNKLKKAYRRYFKNAVRKIKNNPSDSSIPAGLAIALGIIGIGLGIVVLVCGVGCGSTGGGIALAVVGGLALVGLGVWALIAGFRKTSRTN